MVDLCFTARAATKHAIIAKLGQLSLERNDSGQYTNAAITQLVKGIQRVLKQQYNPAGGSNGILNLLDCNTKEPQANKTTTAEEILRASQREAIDKSVKTGTIVAPKLTLRVDAQYEANQRNIISQALVGPKEGVFEALTKFVGTDITDSVLRHTNSKHKGLDEYTLHELIQATIDSTNCPPATDVLIQLRNFINYVFDFRKKISASMEGMQQLLTNTATYGIIVPTPKIVLTLMANIDIAAREEYRYDFQLALQTIWAKYTHNHRHNEASLKVILKELTKADLARSL
jgi:hypothetical protein